MLRMTTSTEISSHSSGCSPFSSLLSLHLSSRKHLVTWTKQVDGALNPVNNDGTIEPAYKYVLLLYSTKTIKAFLHLSLYQELKNEFYVVEPVYKDVLWIEAS
jgi:hypothetical protein